MLRKTQKYFNGRNITMYTPLKKNLIGSNFENSFSLHFTLGACVCDVYKRKMYNSTTFGHKKTRSFWTTFIFTDSQTWKWTILMHN